MRVWWVHGRHHGHVHVNACVCMYVCMHTCECLTVAEHVGFDHAPDDILREAHHVVVVCIRLVQLNRRKLRVVAAADALISEYAAYLIHALHAAHDQPLEVQLGGDAQREGTLQRVVVCHKGAGFGTAGVCLQYWRLDLGARGCGCLLQHAGVCCSMHTHVRYVQQEPQEVTQCMHVW